MIDFELSGTIQDNLLNPLYYKCVGICGIRYVEYSRYTDLELILNRFYLGFKK